MMRFMCILAACLAAGSTVRAAPTQVGKNGDSLCSNSTAPHSSACLELWFKEAGCLGGMAVMKRITYTYVADDILRQLSDEI